IPGSTQESRASPSSPCHPHLLRPLPDRAIIPVVPGFSPGRPARRASGWMQDGSGEGYPSVRGGWDGGGRHAGHEPDRGRDSRRRALPGARPRGRAGGRAAGEVALPGGGIGRGLVVAVVGRVAGLILVVPLISISRRFIGSDLKPFEGARTDPVLLAVVAALVLVGAPFVEELFFRGLLLRSLLPLLGPRGAIAAQALVFAALHLRPSYGLGNVSLVLAIGTMGIVQGIVAERYRRLA